MAHRCRDCGEQIGGQGAKRCKSCAMKVCHAKGVYDEIYYRPEYRRKQSRAAKARWARGVYDGTYTPERLRRMSKGMKAAYARGVYNNPECRCKQSGAAKVRWGRGDYDKRSTPEYRRRLSEARKAAHARGDYDKRDTSEYRRKLSEALQRPGTRRKMSDARRESWARGDYDDVFQSPTSIELAVAAALDICGVAHTSQYRPEGYSRIFDEFISPDVLIEIQGDYWHGPEKPENQGRDIEKAAWAEENGYRLVVMWEHEIKERGARALVCERVLPLWEVKQ